MADQINLADDARYSLVETSVLTVSNLASGVANVKVFQITMPKTEVYNKIITLNNDLIKTALNLSPNDVMYIIEMFPIADSGLTWNGMLDKTNQVFSIKLESQTNEDIVSLKIICTFKVDLKNSDAVSISNMVYTPESPNSSNYFWDKK